MAILTYTARVLIAKFLVTHPIHLAIGTGNASWDTKLEPPDYEDTKLIHEVGRIGLRRYVFVNDNEHGEIDLPGGRSYSESATPTRQIYCEFRLRYGEGVFVPIREVGLFVDTKIKSGLPSTQNYFTPDQIDDPGTLVTLEHLDDSETFTPTKTGTFGTVLSI